MVDILDTATGVMIHDPYLGTSQDLSSNPFAVKCKAYELPDTADGGDVFKAACTSTLQGINVYSHTTKDEVIVTSATEFTSTISTTAVEVTLPTGDDNIKFVVVLWYT